MKSYCWPVCLLAALPGAFAADPAPAKIRTRLHAMFSESAFATVNRNDAMASLRVWIGALGKRRGFDFDSKLEIFKSVEEVMPRLRAGTVDVLVLDTPDYLNLIDSGLIEPVAAGEAYRYLLLGREPLGPGGFRELRGTRAAVASRTRGDMGVAWLQALLASNRLGTAESLFSAVSVQYKPSACVLPVFFGKADVCAVDAQSWKLLTEMNPQLGRLKVLAQSELLSEGIVAMPVLKHPYRQELIESILEIHKDPAGSQMITLFRTGPMQAVTKAQFDGVRELWNRYLKATGRDPVKPKGEGK